jgi:glucose/arabinose dehydrogenase
MSPKRVAIGALIAFAVVNAGVADARAASVEQSVKLVRVAPLLGATATAVRGGDPTLYVANQGGVVRAIRRGRVVAGDVLDLTKDTAARGEQGLLGIAFAPDGKHLYADYTDLSGDTHVDEFAMTGNVADPSSRRNILFVDQPQPNHNGGQLAFGPDGYLYIAFGDGGNFGDQGPGHARGGNGQSLDTLLGKILRIDVKPSATAPYIVPPDNPFVGQRNARGEIWSYGLRNPWRFSFDASTGDLWIGDVGQDAWEEIDYSAAKSGRDAARGSNFGWNRLEGTHPYQGDPPDNAVPPVYEASHSAGACSITGGFVYRGARIPGLRGKYVFTDYCDGVVRALTHTSTGRFRASELGLSLPSVSTFGEGPDHELYLLSQSQGVFRLAPRAV